MLLRQTVCRAQSSHLMAAPPEGATVISPTVTTAIHNLLQIVAELRSPQGGWPSELPQTPETLTPYVSEEAYELLDALRQSPLPQSIPTIDLASLSLNCYCTIEALISPLLWALFRSAYEIMRLIEGIEVDVTAPGQNTSEQDQTGVLRLATVLVLKTPTGDRALDLVTQDNPQVDQWLDTQVFIHSLEPGIWPQTAEGKTLLSAVEHQIQQQMPLLQPWLSGLAIDYLHPNSPWQQGSLQLQFGLSFTPLSAATAAVETELDVLPEITPEVIIPIPVSEPIAVGTAAPRHLTILDLFSETAPPQLKGSQPVLGLLGAAESQTLADQSTAYPAPKANEDLFSNFADSEAAHTHPNTLDKPVVEPRSSQPNPSAPQPKANASNQNGYPSKPLAIQQTNPVPLSPINRVDHQAALDLTQPDPSRSPDLHSWISFTDEAWLQQFLDILAYQQLLDRLSQSPHQFAQTTTSDYGQLLHHLITAAYLTVDRLQSSTGFFQQGFWHQSILLSDWMSRLWWYIIRSSNQIMHWIGGNPAKWLQPGQTWQSGTLQWVLGLSLKTETQTQCLDLTTGLPLDLMPPAPDTILALAMTQPAGNSDLPFLSTEHSPQTEQLFTLATLQQQLRTLLSNTSPALDGLFQGTAISLHQLTAEAEETMQTGHINLYLVPRFTSD